MRRQRTGRRGEELAGRHLETLGLRIRERNVRLPPGELDLVAEDGPTLVFVEVRTTGQQTFGSAAESVTGQKRRRLIRLAQTYLQRHPHSGPWRIDVVTVEWHAGRAHLRHLPSAVEA